MNRLGTCLLLLLLLLARGLDSAAAAEVVDASVCDVLANPASFDGRVIRIKTAMVMAGFDEFVVNGFGCNPVSAIWLAYPEGAKGKAGPAAFVRLQVAKNGPAVGEAPKRAPVTLERNGDFKRFDSLLATPYKSSALCLGCPKYTVSATLVGRLDGASASGVVRDGEGKLAGIDGFGNLNLYRARLVLQSVSDVVPKEIDSFASAKAVRGDSRRAGSPSAHSVDQAKRALEAFGKEDEDNGVVVGFGVVNEVPKDERAKGSGDSPDGILFLATFDMDRLGKKVLSRAMVHVGTHIADIRSGTLVNGLDEAESRAWATTFGE